MVTTLVSPAARGLLDHVLGDVVEPETVVDLAPDVLSLSAKSMVEKGSGTVPAQGSGARAMRELPKYRPFPREDGRPGKGQALYWPKR